VNDEAGFGADETIASLFQPDILLPAQYLESFRRKTPLEPETTLMLAVLEDAIACFQKSILARGGRGRRMFRGAEEWILEEKSGWLFSFENICEVLGFNPECVRKGLMRRKKIKFAGRSKVKICHWTPGAESKKSSSRAEPAPTSKQKIVAKHI